MTIKIRTLSPVCSFLLFFFKIKDITVYYSTQSRFNGIKSHDQSCVKADAQSEQHFVFIYKSIESYELTPHTWLLISVCLY